MKEEIYTRRAMLRSEFDHLAWRKKRIDERLDQLAKEIDDLTIELAVSDVVEAAAEQLPSFMEFVETGDKARAATL